MQTVEQESELKQLRNEKKIREIAEAYSERGFTVSGAMTETAIRRNSDPNDFARSIVNSQPTADFGADTRVLENMQRSERRQFSLCRMIRTLGANRPLDGYEAEVCAEFAKESGRGARGHLIPASALSVSEIHGQRDFMSAGSYGKGGSTVPVDHGPMINKLDPKPVVEMAGATVLRGLTGSLSLPRQTGAVDAHWIAEGADIPASTMATDDVLLTPHGVAAFVPITKQLTLQSSVDIESWLRAELQRRINLAVDRAALIGPGTGGVPKGLFHLASSAVNETTFGGAPTHAKVVEMETLIDDNDGLQGNLAYITSGAVAGKWKTTTIDSGSGKFILENGRANDYPVLRTSQMATGDFAHHVGFGNWSDCVISMWGGYDLTVDPFTLANSGKIRLVLLAHVDVAFRHGKSFTVSTDAANQ